MRSLSPLHVVVISSVVVSAAACGASERPDDGDEQSREIPGVALLDNGEDADATTLTDEAGWVGYWYTYDDRNDCVNELKTGTLEPPSDSFMMTAYDANNPGPPVQGMQEENLNGARFWGGGHASASEGGFGAGLGVGLNNSPSLSAFNLVEKGFVGIYFWARSAIGPQPIDVKIKDQWSEPAANKCIPRDEAVCEPTQACHDDPMATKTLSTEWTEYRIMFSEFNRAGWSLNVAAPGGYVDGMTPPDDGALDPTTAYQLQFQVGPVENFDIWIDNVGFILADGGTAPMPTDTAAMPSATVPPSTP